MLLYILTCKLNHRNASKNKNKKRNTHKRELQMFLVVYKTQKYVCVFCCEYKLRNILRTSTNIEKFNFAHIKNEEKLS